MTNHHSTLAALCSADHHASKKYATTVILTFVMVGLGTAIIRRIQLQLTPDEIVLEHNVVSGSIIFTIGDIGAQYLTHPSTSSSSLSRQQQRRTHLHPFGRGGKDSWFASYHRSPHDIAQTISSFASSLPPLDRQRLAISTALGALWLGVANPAVYAAVERAFPGSDTWGRVVLKMVLSCSFLSTAGNWITMFFRRYMKQICEVIAQQQQQQPPSSRSRNNVKDHRDTPSSRCYRLRQICYTLRTRWECTVTSCNDDFFDVLLDDLKVWPLYDIVCYTIIPIRLRPLTTAVMASCWSIYMSVASATTNSAAATSTTTKRSTAIRKSSSTSLTDQDEDDDISTTTTMVNMKPIVETVREDEDNHHPL